MTKIRDKTQTNLAVTRLAVASNLVLTAGKMVVGLIMGSAAVIAEGIHSGVDLIAALVAFWAVRQARRPADGDHAYGHGKYDALSGAIEGLLIFGAAAFIIVEAVRKIIHRTEVEQLGLGAAVMAVSAVVNFIVSARLFRAARLTGSLAVEADGQHLRTDVWTSAGVFVGLALIHLTGFHLLDPLAALVVAVLIIKAAWDITGKSFADLLDRRLPPAEEKNIERIVIEGHPHWVQVHALRTRRAGGQRHVDLHLVTCPEIHLDAAHHFTDDVEDDIRREYPNAEVITHVEPCEKAPTECDASCPMYEVRMQAPPPPNPREEK